MTEQTDAPQGGAEGVDASAAVEAHSEATTEQTTGAEQTGQADDAGEATEESPKRVPWFQKRIDEVTAQKYEAAREAAYWRGIAEGRTPTQAATQPEVPDDEPTLEQFDYDEVAFRKAHREYVRKETEKSIDRTLSEREQKRTEEEKNYAAITKLQEAGSKHSDFIAAVSGLPANEAVRDFILTTENAADVLYELGKDPQASERFSSLSPLQQAIELGRRAATPKATTRTIAPPPPQTVAGIVSGIGKTPEEMSMAEYAQWVKERDKD